MQPTKTEIDPGTVARVSGSDRRNILQRGIAAAIRYALTPEIVNAWQGPGQVIPPVAQDAAGRLLDYSAGVNTQTRPRHGELVTFQMLRGLADAYDLMRLVIERRKDQMEALRWKFVTKDSTDKEDEDARVKQLKEFFAKPDKQHAWGPWLRMMVEEILVIDALTLYPRKTNGQQLYSLDIIDGSTIKVIVDDMGRRPMSPLPAYQQFLKGVPAAQFNADELMYRPRNPRAGRFYGYSPVEQVIMTVNIALRRQTHQLNYYTEGNIPEAFVPVPENWTPKNIKEFQEAFDAMMSSDLGQRRKAKFIPNVKNLIFTREPNLKDMMDEWLGRIICFAFAYPPSALTAQVNRATADDAREAGNDEGLAPLMQTVRNIINEVIVTHFGFDDVTFEWDVEQKLAPEVLATVHKTQLESDVITLDEARIEAGKQPYNIKGITDVPSFMREQTPREKQEAEAAAAALEGASAGKAGEGNVAGSRAADDGAPSAKKTDEEDEAVKKAAPRASVERLASQRRTLIVQSEMVLTSQLAALLSAAADTIAEKAAEEFGLAKASGSALDEATLNAFIDNVLVELTGAKKGLRKALQAVAQDGVRITLTSLGNEDADALTVANKRAAAYAAKRAGELITEAGDDGDLVEATRKLARAAIAEAVERGATAEELAKTLREGYAFSEKRAAMIARTELRAADVAGNLEAYKASGVVDGKRWLVSADNVCEVCIANAEQGVVKLDSAFDSGDMGPPAHPNCQCDIAPVVNEE